QLRLPGASHEAPRSLRNLLHGETVVLEQISGRRGCAETVDADDVAAPGDVAPPAVRRAGFDDDARGARRQDVVAIFLRLAVERLATGHGDDARGRAGAAQLGRGGEGERDLGAG